MPDKKIVFAVQGEGRGHLTQAISVYEMLISKGYTVAAVIVGSSKGKTIPAFVRERIQVPIITLQSPHFIKDRDNRGISLFKTIGYSIGHITTYLKSIRKVHQTIEAYKPDLLINFYEPLIGLAALIKRTDTKIISIAHQYLYLHPDFIFPDGSSKKNQWLIRLYTRLTALSSEILLGLSFYPMERKKHNHIKVCPPLLRNEITGQDVYTGKHILVYLVNAGYMKNIIQWHKEHPQIELHCFTDSPAIKGKWQYHENLYFHSLDDRKFLYYMANAMALVTTAGFESVCEAMYMGKPVLMVPVENHFEQWCNARDASSCGAGIFADCFDINALLKYLPEHVDNSEMMRSWVCQAEPLLIETIEGILNIQSSAVNTNMEVLEEKVTSENIILTP
jgi:uncharacterized protein (TIGR00661 family)